MKRFTLFLCVLGLVSFCVSPIWAACTKKREHTRVADFGKRAMPLAALGVSLVKTDWWGAVGSQVAIHSIYGLNRALEDKIHKKRPCGCDGAFPSGHMIMYASSASYLHYRYGWQYGFPAYVAAFGFAYDRVDNKAHGWDDMIGTFAIINVLAYFITPRYTPDVEYLPTSWLGEPEKPDKTSEAFYIKEFRMREPKRDYLPIVYGDIDTYLVGFSMRF